MARPVLGVEEAEAVASALRSGWVGQGPQVAAFEERLAELLGAAHVVAVSSGTTGLHVSLLALGIGPGDEVIVPASSFVATANAVLMTGARPVFADVHPRTANLDLQDAAARITTATRALLVVHQLGLPVDLRACLALCAERGISLVEDAACALGSWYGGEPIGRPHGAMACFSFHPRKVITTGEGGAISTSDSGLAEHLRRLRNHGALASGLPAHLPSAVTYPELGFNGRMSDLAAAVGLVQLGRLPALLERRAALAARYHRLLAGHSDLELPELAPSGVVPNWQSFQLLVSETSRLSRDALAEALFAAGIDTRPGLMALHREPLYSASAPLEGLPGAETVAARGMMLPMHPGLTDDDADRVAGKLLDVLSV